MIHDSSFFSHMKGMGLSVACLKVSRTPWELFRELPGGSVPSVEMAQLPRLVSSHHGSGPSIKRPSPAAPGTPGPGSREWPAHPPQGENSGVSLADVTGGGFLSLVGQLMDLVI